MFLSAFFPFCWPSFSADFFFTLASFIFISFFFGCFAFDALPRVGAFFASSLSFLACGFLSACGCFFSTASCFPATFFSGAFFSLAAFFLGEVGMGLTTFSVGGFPMNILADCESLLRELSPSEGVAELRRRQLTGDGWLFIWCRISFDGDLVMVRSGTLLAVLLVDLLLCCVFSSSSSLTSSSRIGFSFSPTLLLFTQSCTYFMAISSVAMVTSGSSWAVGAGTRSLMTLVSELSSFNSDVMVPLVPAFIS